MATVLVTDGEQRSALAAVRSLGRAGHRVEVCSESGRSLAGASRHASGDHRVSWRGRGASEWAEAVARLAARAGAGVVVPATDVSMLALLPRRELLEDAVIPFGDMEAYRALSDKAGVASMARELGMPVPEQRVLNRPGEVTDPDLGWPLVVKPSRSVAERDDGFRKHAVRYASSPGELEERLRDLPASAFPVLLQRRIIGTGTGVFLLRWDGVTRAVFAHRRLREKPPSGGVSVYREAVAAEPNLVRSSEQLLERVGWQGVAMVEFRAEGRTGLSYLMEVNARLWGSMQLAVDAGVDFPRLLVDAALGSPAARPPEYRVGVRSRWWWGDVDHLIARLRGERAPSTERRGAGLLRAVLEFLLLWRPGDRYEVLRAGDPRPFLRETRDWVAPPVGERGGG